MKIDFKIDGVKVTIEDDNIICSDVLIKNQIESVIKYEQETPQDGYFSFLQYYFESVEIINVEEKEQLIY